MSNHEYDPGTPYDPPPRRRRRRSYRRGGEYEDAWAAADEDDFYDNGVEIEDLAAGYLWEDGRYERHQRVPTARDEDDPDAGTPLPGAGRSRGRGRVARRERITRRYDRSQVYANSRSYHRDQARRGEYGEYFEKPKRYPGKPDTGGGLLQSTPFWQILVLVILGLVAVLVTALACVSVLAL